MFSNRNLALLFAFFVAGCTSDAVDTGEPWGVGDPSMMDPEPAYDDPVYHDPESFEGAPLEGGGTALVPGPDSCWTTPITPYRVGGYQHGSRINTNRVHAGLDISGAAGTLVENSTDGIVIVAGDVSTWGGYIEVLSTTEAGEDFYVQYGHFDPATITVRVGDFVPRGEVLGALGTRLTNGGWPPHLHHSAFVGQYPSSGVLAGHVREQEFAFYRDPFAFLEATMIGANCTHNVSIPSPTCDITCEDLAPGTCGKRLVCAGQAELDCGPCDDEPVCTASPRTRCDGGQVIEDDGCGVVRVVQDCEHGCTAGSCDACQPLSCEDFQGCGSFADGCGGSLLQCGLRETKVCDGDRVVYEDECGDVQRVQETCADGCVGGRCIECTERCVAVGERDPVVGVEAVGGGQVLDLRVVDADRCGVIELEATKADGSLIGVGDYLIRVGSCRHFGYAREQVTIGQATATFRVTLDHRGGLNETKEFCVTKHAGPGYNDPDHEAWWWSNFVIVDRVEECR